jgi:diaminohydroxyphosphoribosylaminopyrimidine deaminase/5-amino-6-(5-phosphoribosylamino)uracil reductase
VDTAAESPDVVFMRLALGLAWRGYGHTSPNPMVGAVLVKRGRIIGQGWHRRAGEPHAEIEALRDAERRGLSPRGATLYVTLEPCCTSGRTPPCTEAILRAGIARVVTAATDPNPQHAGRGFAILRSAGVTVTPGLLAGAATRLNEAFNHWIVHRLPFVTVKAALTLDGKIATATGQSKWITGEAARRHAMDLRAGADAMLAGINTVLADDPSLTVRLPGLPRPPSWLQSANFETGSPARKPASPTCQTQRKPVRRLILDARARTPLDAKLVSDEWAASTTVFVGSTAPARRREALAHRVNLVVAPEITEGESRAARRQGTRPARSSHPRLDLSWILRRLGGEEVSSLLVEGGGEVNASFFEQRLVQRVAFYYAPRILGESAGRKAVAGPGFGDWPAIVRLSDVEWRRVGTDFFLTACVDREGPNHEAK